MTTALVDFFCRSFPIPPRRRLWRCPGKPVADVLRPGKTPSGVEVPHELDDPLPAPYTSMPWVTRRVLRTDASKWSRPSKVAIRCHALPMPVPILKNPAFDLMTDPRIAPAHHQEQGEIVNLYRYLREGSKRCSSFNPGRHHWYSGAAKIVRRSLFSTGLSAPSAESRHRIVSDIIPKDISASRPSGPLRSI